MTHDKKNCLKAIIMWILVIILLIIVNVADGEKKEPINNFTIKEKVLDDRAETLDNYFKSKGMPIAGNGKTFVAEADEHKIDWRLLAAISVQESTGGKRMPAGSYNAFGWNSGNYKFKSFEDAIAYISDKFQNGRYYTGKNTIEILKTYNPPSVNKNYPAEVMSIMETMWSQRQ